MPSTERDGVALHYEDAGAGEGTPPLLLVHSLTGDHTHFAPQVEHFRQRHRTVAVDLRGHGQSGKPERGYTIATFVADLVHLCGAAGLERPVVVGHALGGAVALELGARHPELVSAVAILDAPVAVPPSSLIELGPVLEGMQAGDPTQAWRRFLAASFRPLDDAARRERILDAASAAPATLVRECSHALWTWDGAAAARVCKLPVLLVGAIIPYGVRMLKTLMPQVILGQTVGAGHFLQLEVPAQVNSMLERFIALAAPRAHD